MVNESISSDKHVCRIPLEPGAQAGIFERPTMGNLKCTEGTPRALVWTRGVQRSALGTLEGSRGKAPAGVQGDETPAKALVIFPI